MELKLVKIEKPDDMNFILGQSHFIKTVEDLHEAIVNVNAQARFGLAFCEASGPCLIRFSGSDERINVLAAVKAVPEVVVIFCASANPVEVLVVQSQQGRGILGVIDGFAPKGFETPDDVRSRKEFLRKIGYKL